jgi:virginiamycin B lyase
MDASRIVRTLGTAALTAALLAGCNAGNFASAPPGAQGQVLVQAVPKNPGNAAGRASNPGLQQFQIAAPTHGPHFMQYVSIPGTTPFYITTGPNNSRWFTTGDTPGSIGRLRSNRSFKLFKLPPSGPNASLRIVQGPFGSFWVTLDGGIAKITPNGRITVYRTNANADLGYITVGPDDNVWFTEHDANKFARISPDGKVTEFPFEDIGAPNGIVAGPDQLLWICEQGAYDAKTGHQTFGRIERVIPADGTIYATYPIPPDSWENVPENITVGADHKLWFTQFNAISQVIYEISKVSLQGKIVQYRTPNVNAGPGSPTLGGDRNVWFTEAYGSALARVTPSGKITEFPLPPAGSIAAAPYGLTAGGTSHREIWFADYQNGRLGQFAI